MFCLVMYELICRHEALENFDSKEFGLFVLFEDVAFLAYIICSILYIRVSWASHSNENVGTLFHSVAYEEILFCNFNMFTEY